MPDQELFSLLDLLSEEYDDEGESLPSAPAEEAQPEPDTIVHTYELDPEMDLDWGRPDPLSVDYERKLLPIERIRRAFRAAMSVPPEPCPKTRLQPKQAAQPRRERRPNQTPRPGISRENLRQKPVKRSKSGENPLGESPRQREPLWKRPAPKRQPPQKGREAPRSKRSAEKGQAPQKKTEPIWQEPVDPAGVRLHAKPGPNGISRVPSACPHGIGEPLSRRPEPVRRSKHRAASVPGQSKPMAVKPQKLERTAQTRLGERQKSSARREGETTRPARMRLGPLMQGGLMEEPTPKGRWKL